MQATRWRSAATSLCAPAHALLALALLGAAAWSFAQPAAAAAPGAPPAVHLVLNIPAYRLDVVRDGAIVATFGVAVGMRKYPTPTGDFDVTRIIWNPWWYPPDREWAAGERVTPPGPRNPMGRVKLLMRGPYYLHGSPFESSIGTAASHGCLRMRNRDAIALGRLLQQSTAAPITDADVDVLTTRSRRTREVTLPQPVPLHIAYQVVEVRRDSLLVHRDVYRRGTAATRRRAIDALARAGVDAGRVDVAVLDSLLRAGRASHASIALDGLLGADTDSGDPPGRVPQ
ncbi:MAG TPA: L,D-transpeptidase [Gemmatimonadaceae bacterium]|nr:L,D-transpeptidase [Gemmatimonadaceae bacterium]